MKTNHGWIDLRAKEVNDLTFLLITYGKKKDAQGQWCTGIWRSNVADYIYAGIKEMVDKHAEGGHKGAKEVYIWMHQVADWWTPDAFLTFHNWLQNRKYIGPAMTLYIMLRPRFWYYIEAIFHHYVSVIRTSIDQIHVQITLSTSEGDHRCGTGRYLPIQ